jgi:hypothetical protein
MEVAILAYFLEPVMRAVMGRNGSSLSTGRSSTFCSNDIRIISLISRFREAEPFSDWLGQSGHPFGPQERDEMILGQ